MKTETTTRPPSGWVLQRQPTTPGEMLLKEFLEPRELSQHALAMKIGVPATRIADIVHGRRAVSADTALRLGRFFETSPEFWLNLQQAVDLYETRNKLASQSGATGERAGTSVRKPVSSRKQLVVEDPAGSLATRANRHRVG